MVNLPPEVRTWLADGGQGEVISADAVEGGSIHQALSLRTEAGKRYFLKTNPAPARGMFSTEAEGLKALQVPGGPVIPRVFLIGEDFLLLEDLQPGPRRIDFWPTYGRQLAHIHRQINPRFGFASDNYIGSSPQQNGWMDDGVDFFKERRLQPQIRWGVDKGLLDPGDARSCEGLLPKLADLLPEMPAVLLHGDLWSGNLITDSSGSPALIDPAAYYGWAEADLAMAELFGTYPDPFYAAYQELNPLIPGYRDRFPIYNLYHLLNHLNIFGRSYLSQVREVLRRFA
jgi:protein-ribulosamine 3-kinase